MRRLDLRHRSGAGKSAANLREQSNIYRLPEPPSLYFKRNVRVTPFVFEDVARDIQDYDLADILCFSSDYPHIEGGRNCFETFYDKLAPLGEGVLGKVFVTNGELLLPA